MDSKQRKRKRQILMELQGGKCCYCQQKMTNPPANGGKHRETDATFEHLDSRINTKRGTFSLGVRRVLLACFRCNQEKNEYEQSLLSPRLRCIRSEVGKILKKRVKGRKLWGQTID